MVSMAVFSILALTLAIFMNATVDSYTLGTSRKSAYSTATAILNQLELDLVQAFLAPGGMNPDVDVRFLATRDEFGNSRLGFVAMSSNPAASDPETPGSDIGLREICWYMSSSGTIPFSLMRGERLQIGGEGSIIDDPGTNTSNTGTFGKNIGYFSVRFIPDASSLSDEGINLGEDVLERGYPVWDSTRGNPALTDFGLYDEGSANDPWDDIMPMRVVVTLTVIPDTGMLANLMETLDNNATKIVVDTTNGFPPLGGEIDPFIFIDNEWMQYDGVDEETFSVFLRGAHGTVPAPHPIGAQVRAGYSFIRTIVIPCGGKAVR